MANAKEEIQRRRRERIEEQAGREQQHEVRRGVGEQEEQVQQEQADLMEIEPYFPEGLACADDRFQFNFDFFLMDELRLSHGLLASDGTVHRTFTDVVQCNTYCMEYVDHFHVPEGRGAPDDLIKAEMFHECGKPLEDMLRTGEAGFDQNLRNMRTDRYGNVMMLGAPKWSDLCPNFMHGFPRAMCPRSHGGFLKGNITVAARISNQVIRTMCPGDIASMCSKATLTGLGLTVSELFLARQAALKYCNKERQPHRLVMAMVRYGIDFLTLSTMQPRKITTLMGAAVTACSQSLALQASESDTSDSSAGSSDEAAELDVPIVDMNECRSETHAETLVECSLNMMFRFVSRGQALPVGRTETAADRAVAPVEPVQPRQPAQLSAEGQARRKRRRSTGGQASIVPSQATSTSRRRPVDQLPDMRQRLSEFPGIKMARVPRHQTLTVMKDFMTKNLPIPVEEVQAEVMRLGSENKGDAAAGRSIQADRRTKRVLELLQRLWQLERHNCVCPVPEDGGDTQDGQCSYKLDDMYERDIDPGERPCKATDECKVCTLFADNRYFSGHCTRTTRNKNIRMQFLLTTAPALAEVMWSMSVQTSAENTREIRSIWRELLCCSEEKLLAVLNVGHLVQILPGLQSLTLTSGWSKFWKELRKLGAALAYQGTDEAKLATLLYIRTDFVPDNAWKAVLTAGTELEQQVWNILCADQNLPSPADQGESNHEDHDDHDDHDHDHQDQEVQQQQDDQQAEKD